MDSGQLVAICCALLVFSLCIPWILAIRYKEVHTRKTSRQSKNVVENSNNYRRFEQYTILVVCYAIVIATYVVVIDHAANNPGFLGKQGKSHNINFEVLSFIRTGFAVIHLPLLTAVLAATVPYWTMAKPDRSPPETAAPQPTKDALNHLEQHTRVTQLFYLADRTWAGLLGWITTFIYGWKDRAFSYIWAQLAVIAALAYIGFSLLSLAYVTKNTQYWDPSLMPATINVGGMSQSYINALQAIRNPNDWMGSETFLNWSLNANLVGFNSSSKPSSSNVPTLSNGIENSWANNQTFTTLAPPKTEDNSHNVQLPLAGIKASASCGLSNYNLAQLFQGNETGSTIVPNLGFDTTGPSSNGSSPFTLRCINDCSNLGNSTALACSTQSSIVNITSFIYRNESGYDVEAQQNTNHYTFFNVSSTVPGQALSCVQQDYTDLQSTAAILLAVQGANNITQVATCDFSVTYMKPTVNTLLGQYIDSTGLSSAISGLNATPAELLNLSMASYINFFHEGPPILTYPPAPTYSSLPNCTIPPITSGFQWISSWAPLCYQSGLPTVVTNESKPTTLLNVIAYSEYVTGLSSFDERMFLGPLASFINDPTFYQNGTVTGVTFKVENGLAYGKVPAVLALVVLAIPILWTIALSVITNTQRRWTASLDAFAIFKLGADWHGDLQELRLVSLGKANERIMSIPGTVVVDPETGMVELAHARPRRRLSRNSRRPGWLQQRGCT